MHRYAFASGFCQGQHVLDAACGEGYGSALLAGHSETVTGVDIDSDVIAHARKGMTIVPLRLTSKTKAKIQISRDKSAKALR